MNPEDWQWTLPEMLLAEIGDAVNLTAWAKVNGRRRDRPKPIARPGVEKPEVAKFGTRTSSLDKLKDWLGWAE